VDVSVGVRVDVRVGGDRVRVRESASVNANANVNVMSASASGQDGRKKEKANTAIDEPGSYPCGLSSEPALVLVLVLEIGIDEEAEEGVATAEQK